MTSASMESWYRRFLLVLAGGIYLITPIELVFTEHTEGILQWVPFVACSLGLLGLLSYRFWGKKARKAVWLTAFISVASGLLGIFKHVEHNLGFELDIRPNAGWADVWWETLTGASPMLAPGILILAAIMGLAAIRKPAAYDS